MAKQSRMVLSNETLNSRGFVVLTKGIDLTRFKANPVMFYNHRTYSQLPIGRWDNLKVSKKELTADPVFDSEDEQAALIEGKYERKMLNACSIGIRIHEYEYNEDLETFYVTKCELLEASIVGIPANPSAVRLYDSEGEEILAETPKEINLHFQKSIDMKKSDDKNQLKKLIEELGAALGISSTEKSKGKKSKAKKGKGKEVDEKSVEEQLSALTAKLENMTTEIENLKTESTEKDEALSTEKQKVKKLTKTLKRAYKEIKMLGNQEAGKEISGKGSKDQGGGNEEELSVADEKARKDWDKNQKK